MRRRASGVGRRLGIPAAALNGPLALGALLTVTGALRLELPGWLLAASYAVVGWRIGLSFTPDIVRVALRSAPRVLAAIGLLIAFSAGLALLLARLAGKDLVTAYLATSPGGADSVAIIAQSTPVDVPFVMAMQVLRFVVVLVAGPLIARAGGTATALTRHRISTSSSAMVGCSATVSSNCCLVSPALTAIAAACRISGQSGPIMWMPTIRPVSPSHTSL